MDVARGLNVLQAQGTACAFGEPLVQARLVEMVGTRQRAQFLTELVLAEAHRTHGILRWVHAHLESRQGNGINLSSRGRHGDPPRRQTTRGDDAFTLGLARCLIVATPNDECHGREEAQHQDGECPYQGKKRGRPPQVRS